MEGGEEEGDKSTKECVGSEILGISAWLTLVVREPRVACGGGINGDDQKAFGIDRPRPNELEGQLLRVQPVGLLEMIDGNLI